jgi:malonyl CoA-acyl carrier protein transacylase
MIVVKASVEKVNELIKLIEDEEKMNFNIDIAVINSPLQIVVSGELEKLKRVSGLNQVKHMKTN